MEKPQERNAAIDELLREDSPKHYSETLDMMFEAWLCSNFIDGTTVEERSVILNRTKALKCFFNAI